MSRGRGGQAARGKALHVVITCEHGGNRIPARYRRYFRGQETLLHSHCGYDAGALEMARDLAKGFTAPLFFSTTSRLLVDLNRSTSHPRLYSPALRNAPAAVREEILNRHYLPFRREAEAEIARAVKRGMRVIHVSSHSFTPELNGEVRNADVGLLYDPARAGESALCARWLAALRTLAPGLKVRRNYPYTGKSDGFSTHLRRRFPPDAYLGVELEINQRLLSDGGDGWRRLRRIVIRSLAQSLPS